MESPCIAADSAQVWIFLVIAALSHIRGTALLLKGIRCWGRERRARQRRGRPDRS